MSNRTWKAGRAKLRGQFVAIRGELVLIEDLLGNTRRVDIKRLSRADLLWLIRTLRDKPEVDQVVQSEGNQRQAQPFRKVQVGLSFGGPIRTTISGMT